MPAADKDQDVADKRVLRPSTRQEQTQLGLHRNARLCLYPQDLPIRSKSRQTVSR